MSMRHSPESLLQDLDDSELPAIEEESLTSSEGDIGSSASSASTLPDRDTLYASVGEKTPSLIQTRLQQQLFDAVRANDVASVAASVRYLQVDVDTVNEYRETPLAVAAVYGHRKVIDRLVELGADVNHRDRNGKTPLMKACIRGFSEIVEHLVVKHGATLEERDTDGRTAVHEATVNGHLNTLDTLVGVLNANVNAQDFYGKTPVFHAVRNHDIAILRSLVVDHNADVFMKDDFQNTVLIEAGLWGAGERVILWLVRRCKLDVDAVDYLGYNALMKAAIYGYVDTVSVLLSVDASAEPQGSHLKTPLICASEHNQIRVAEILLQEYYRSMINCTDEIGETALHKACFLGHSDIVDLLLYHKADIHIKNLLGETALFSAIKAGRVTIVSLLMRSGANADDQDESGATPIIVAGELGHTEVVKLLATQGVDLEKKDSNGRTVLFKSIVSTKNVKNKSILIKVLTDFGADLLSSTGNDETVLEYGLRVLRGAAHDALRSAALEQTYLLYQQGRYLMHRLEYDEAIQMFERTLTLKPDHFVCRIDLIAALLKNKELQRAVDEFKRAKILKRAIPLKELDLPIFQQKHISRLLRKDCNRLILGLEKLAIDRPTGLTQIEEQAEGKVFTACVDIFSGKCKDNHNRLDELIESTLFEIEDLNIQFEMRNELLRDDLREQDYYWTSIYQSVSSDPLSRTYYSTCYQLVENEIEHDFISNCISANSQPSTVNRKKVCNALSSPVMAAICEEFLEQNAEISNVDKRKRINNIDNLSKLTSLEIKNFIWKSSLQMSRFNQSQWGHPQEIARLVERVKSIVVSHSSEIVPLAQLSSHEDISEPVIRSVTDASKIIFCLMSGVIDVSDSMALADLSGYLHWNFRCRITLPEKDLS